MGRLAADGLTECGLQQRSRLYKRMKYALNDWLINRRAVISQVSLGHIFYSLSLSISPRAVSFSNFRFWMDCLT